MIQACCWYKYDVVYYVEGKYVRRSRVSQKRKGEDVEKRGRIKKNRRKENSQNPDADANAPLKKKKKEKINSPMHQMMMTLTDTTKIETIYASII